MKNRIIICILFLSIIPTYVCSDSLEYKIKASFLEKFTRFIEWPSNIIEDNFEPFTISVIGKNPFDEILDIMYSNIKILNMQVKIRYISNAYEIYKTNILFISEQRCASLTEILSVVKDKPILTVSDSIGYAEKGVHINFYKTRDNKIRFEINKTAVQKSGLKMSYLLLRLAKIIDTSVKE